MAAMAAAGCQQPAQQQNVEGELNAVAINFPEFPTATPTAAELQGIHATVMAQVNGGELDDKWFRPASGDAQWIFAGANRMAFASIIPHRKADKGQLVHGKPLTLMRTDSIVSLVGEMELRPGTNYWVAARGGGAWLSVIVTADSVFAVPLNPNTHNDSGSEGEAHKQSAARWVVRTNVFRAGTDAAWATCSSSQCCCTGSSCDIALQ